jgi:hypothetical protein
MPEPTSAGLFDGFYKYSVWIKQTFFDQPVDFLNYLVRRLER